MFCRGFLSELRRGCNGFRKDKGGEKLAESEVIGLPLSLLAEKEHSSNTALTAQTLSILSTSAARLFVPTRTELSLLKLCRVQPNLVHLCTNFHIATLSLSTFQGLFNIYFFGIPAPPSGYRFSAFFCVTITMFWRLNENTK